MSLASSRRSTWLEPANAVYYHVHMSEPKKQTELKVRLSRENLDFLEHYAAARHLTAAKIIDLDKDSHGGILLNACSTRDDGYRLHRDLGR